MKVRELERWLCDRGISAAKMDATTRKLRERGHLPIGGRGPNAPDIQPRDAATILLAVAGSSKAIEAGERFEKLAQLQRSGQNQTLLSALTNLLTDHEALQEIVEVRVCRTRRRATFLFRDGKAKQFGSLGTAQKTERFFVEGVIPAEMLQLIAQKLQAKSKP